MGDLEVDTRLEAVAGKSGGYRANLCKDWEIWGPNGGYVAAIALRATGREAAIQRPSSFAGHFLSIARFAPVQVNVTPVRQGRRAESFRVDIEQEGRAILAALVRTALRVPGLTHDVSRAPEVPDPESLLSVEKLNYTDAPRMAFWQNLEARPLFPERIHEREVARDPVWREWYRFRPRATFDDPFLDAARSLLLIDTLSWPAACQPHPESPYQAPNLDVSVWFHRAAPASDWLLADHVCPVAEGGLMGTIGRVWSSNGELLASGGAQLMCVPRA